MIQALKVAVIGVGHQGKWHADKYASSPDCELLAIVDTNLENAKQIARIYGVHAYGTYHNILSQVDAISLTVPTSLHYKIARDVLEAGVHCLIEKPITETIEDASILIEIAQQNGLVLQVGHIVRFNSVMRDIKEMLQAPQFIESTRIAPFTSRASDVNVIFDLMIHDIDIILDLIDSPIKHISANGLPVLSDRIDIANARIEFDNHCVANITASRISQKYEQKLRIFQKDTYFSADLLRNILSIYRIGNTDNETGFNEITHEKRIFNDNDALNLEILDFIAAIKAGRRPKVSGEDGIRALKTAIAITSRIMSAL